MALLSLSSCFPIMNNKPCTKMTSMASRPSKWARLVKPSTPHDLTDNFPLTLLADYLSEIKNVTSSKYKDTGTATESLSDVEADVTNKVSNATNETSKLVEEACEHTDTDVGSQVNASVLEEDVIYIPQFHKENPESHKLSGPSTEQVRALGPWEVVFVPHFNLASDDAFTNPFND
jgi:hypothetical protein